MLKVPLTCYQFFDNDAYIFTWSFAESIKLGVEICFLLLLISNKKSELAAAICLTNTRQKLLEPVRLWQRNNTGQAKGLLEILEKIKSDSVENGVYQMKTARTRARRKSSSQGATYNSIGTRGISGDLER